MQEPGVEGHVEDGVGKDERARERHFFLVGGREDGGK